MSEDIYAATVKELRFCSGQRDCYRRWIAKFDVEAERELLIQELDLDSDYPDYRELMHEFFAGLVPELFACVLAAERKWEDRAIKTLPWLDDDPSADATIIGRAIAEADAEWLWQVLVTRALDTLEREEAER